MQKKGNVCIRNIFAQIFYLLQPLKDQHWLHNGLHVGELESLGREKDSEQTVIDYG